MTANRTMALPADLNTLSAVHDGTRWLHGIVPGTVTADDSAGTISFDLVWSGIRRHFTLARHVIAGYEQHAETPRG